MMRVVLVVLSLALFPACRRESPTLVLARDDQHVVVVLEMVGNRCTKTIPLPRFVATRNDKVTWHFINYCGEQENVQVSFTDDPTDDEGIETPEKKLRRLDGRVGEKPGRGQIKAKVKGRPDNGNHEGKVVTYSYKVMIGSVAIDPEIIIDWTLPLK